MTDQEFLTVTDSRTGQEYKIPISDGTIRATDLRKIRVSEDDRGLSSYDPGLFNTAVARSSITYLNGEAGVLEYRGYPIEQLAANSTYLEVAYLLIYGHLPSGDELARWTEDISMHTFVHENIKNFMQGFRYDAHPMGMLLASVGGLSTFYSDANVFADPEFIDLHIRRLIAKMPTLGAWAHRHNLGQPYVYPDNELSYTANFLAMLFRMSERTYQPDPRVERALETLFILHADHEQNCSTTAVRVVGSAHADPYSCVAAGIAALYGPLHGGANEAVLKMLVRIGDISNVPDFVEGVKGGKERLMGFGHRVYKSYDPRARLIKQAADDVFEARGTSPLLRIALELEKRALEDEYFVSRKLYPNVDFYSGLIYQALGLPPEMFTVLFAIARTSGWVAQWREMIRDPEQKITRPLQVYTGDRELKYIPGTSRADDRT
jgi:citrate synthase